MQCQLLLLKRPLSLSFFPCAFSVGFGRLCCVFNLRDALLLGKSLGAPEFLPGPPRLSRCCVFGQKSVGTGSVGACREGCTVFVLYKPGGASGSQRWVKEDVLSLAGCFFYLQVLSVKSALSW